MCYICNYKYKKSRLMRRRISQTQSFHHMSMDVKVIMEKTEKDKVQSIEQMVEQLPMAEFMDESGAIVLKKLISTLKNQYNFPLENKEIHFYLTEGDIFMNCGLDPLNEDIKIRHENYENQKTITIKARDLGISLVHRLMSFEVTANANEEREKNNIADQVGQNNKCRRTKQRRIGHIIDKVIEWRKYYAGTSNDRNQTQKYSLEEAAKNVGISKKSLDDYLFQIRFGNKYGFNFNEHYNDKVGVLRDFVRQNKKNDKNEIKNKKNQRFQEHQ